MTEHGIDRLALRLAQSEPQIYRTTVGAGPPVEPVFEEVVKAFGAPVTRRRAVVMISSAVLAGSVLRPGRAGAAAPCPAPLVTCRKGDGRVRGPPGVQCCSNEKCAIA